MYFLNYNPLGSEGSERYVGVLILIVVVCSICEKLFGKDDH